MFTIGTSIVIEADVEAFHSSMPIIVMDALATLKLSYLRHYYEISHVSMHIYIASELYRTPGVRITSVSLVY